MRHDLQRVLNDAGLLVMREEDLAYFRACFYLTLQQLKRDNAPMERRLAVSRAMFKADAILTEQARTNQCKR